MGKRSLLLHHHKAIFAAKSNLAWRFTKSLVVASSHLGLLSFGSSADFTAPQAITPGAHVQ
jgi:hypothetical protein